MALVVSSPPVLSGSTHRCSPFPQDFPLLRPSLLRLGQPRAKLETFRVCSCTRHLTSSCSVQSRFLLRNVLEPGLRVFGVCPGSGGTKEGGRELSPGHFELSLAQPSGREAGSGSSPREEENLLVVAMSSFCRITGKARDQPKPNFFPIIPPISPADAR